MLTAKIVFLFQKKNHVSKTNFLFFQESRSVASSKEAGQGSHPVHAGSLLRKLSVAVPTI